MVRYTGTILDSNGTPQGGVALTIVSTGSTAPIALFDDSGASLANPVTTTSDGSFFFNCHSGTYDFLNSSNAPVLKKVQIFDFTTVNEWLSGQDLTTGNLNVGGNMIVSGNVTLNSPAGVTYSGGGFVVIHGGGLAVDGTTSLLQSGSVTLAPTSYLSFFDGVGALKQTITGARSDTSASGALKSLLTALATLGLITDSST